MFLKSWIIGFHNKMLQKTIKLAKIRYQISKKNTILWIVLQQEREGNYLYHYATFRNYYKGKFISTSQSDTGCKKISYNYNWRPYQRKIPCRLDWSYSSACTIVQCTRNRYKQEINREKGNKNNHEKECLKINSRKKQQGDTFDNIVKKSILR